MQINNEDKVNKLKSAVDINLHNIKSITVRDVIIEDFVNLCVFSLTASYKITATTFANMNLYTIMYNKYQKIHIHDL